MNRDVYINLPVKSLERSVEFYTNIGFTFNPQFTNEKATMMIVSDKASVMLLTEEFFRTFTKKPIGDAVNSPELLTALSAKNRNDVDDIAEKVEKAGGRIVDKFEEMEGAMYGIRFEDLDNHLWEVFYMNMKAM
ncbi:VOC family protein [Prevotella sp. 10(H)]|uniref:VOC family protein n=1 Tax=Prevotella sp. 10(H) TaxID=1158294 RepID=UPI0004A6B7C6|nr:VOC family protein [Prevotella sp. 10(H)]